MPYDSLLFLSNIEHLHQRRADVGKTFSDGVCQEISCLNHLLPDKRDPQSSQRCVTRPGTQYPITVLNVISLSYIMPSVIIKHNNPLRIVCRSRPIIAVLSRSVYCDLMDSIAVLWTLLHSLCTLLHFLYYYAGCIIYSLLDTISNKLTYLFTYLLRTCWESWITIA